MSAPARTDKLTGRPTGEWTPALVVVVMVLSIGALIIMLGIVGVITYGDVLKNRDNDRTSVGSITSRFHDHCGSRASSGVGPNDYTSLEMYICANNALIEARP